MTRVPTILAPGPLATRRRPPEEALPVQDHGWRPLQVACPPSVAFVRVAAWPLILATPLRRHDGLLLRWPAALRSVAVAQANWPCTWPRPCAVAAPQTFAVGLGIVPQTQPTGAQARRIRASSLPGPRQRALFSAAAPFRAPMHPNLPPPAVPSCACFPPSTSATKAEAEASRPNMARGARYDPFTTAGWRATSSAHAHGRRKPQHRRGGVGRRRKTGSCVRFPCVGKTSYLLYSRTWDTCGTWNTWELRYLGDLGHWWSLGCLGEIRS
jgi:hypothetical protein